MDEVTGSGSAELQDDGALQIAFAYNMAPYGKLVDLFHPQEWANAFNSCGYDAHSNETMRHLQMFCTIVQLAQQGKAN